MIDRRAHAIICPEEATNQYYAASDRWDCHAMKLMQAMKSISSESWN